MPEPGNVPLFDSVPTRAARILRAKVGELEADVKDALARDPNNSIAYLTADIALVASILAEFIEWSASDDWTNPVTGHGVDCGCISCHMSQNQ